MLGVCERRIKKIRGGDFPEFVNSVQFMPAAFKPQKTLLRLFSKSASSIRLLEMMAISFVKRYGGVRIE